MDLTTIRYVHIKDPNDEQHHVTSVGYVFDDHNMVHCQIARCQYPDRWSRRIAHEIIKGRFLKYGPDYSFSREFVEQGEGWTDKEWEKKLAEFLRMYYDDYIDYVDRPTVTFVPEEGAICGC